MIFISTDIADSRVNRPGANSVKSDISVIETAVTQMTIVTIMKFVDSCDSSDISDAKHCSTFLPTFASTIYETPYYISVVHSSL